MTTVGILGGGQLGSMLGTALLDLGAEVRFYEPDSDAPAARRFRDVTQAPWTDEKALAQFAARCDVVTYEMEHVEISEGLRALADTTRLCPSLRVLATAQDRALEKAHLAANALPHASFEVARGKAEGARVAAQFPLPFIVKTARGGYDGKGQSFVKDADGARALTFDDDTVYVFEEALDLVLEVSCIVGRDAAGAAVVFPTFENVHAEHILDVTLVPARLPSALRAALEDTARRMADSLDVVGLLTVEFFVTKAGSSRSRGVPVGELEFFVNEIAPRPHNSGHVTRKACSLSQFELLARILLGVPLTKPELLGPATYVMGNLLGDVWLDQSAALEDLDLSAVANFPDVDEVVLYGKREARRRRKMGHFICHAPAPEIAVARARAFREALRRTSST